MCIRFRMGNVKVLFWYSSLFLTLWYWFPFCFLRERESHSLSLSCVLRRPSSQDTHTQLHKDSPLVCELHSNWYYQLNVSLLRLGIQFQDSRKSGIKCGMCVCMERERERERKWESTTTTKVKVLLFSTDFLSLRESFSPSSYSFFRVLSSSR